MSPPPRGPACWGGARSASCSAASSPRRRPAAARSWCCAGSPASARPPCWTSSPSGPRAAGWPARRASSRRWSWPTPGCTSSASPFLDRLTELPVPQQEALGTAFGLRSGPAPDRFLVGLAVLTLLSVVAEDRPLVCVVDDAHWLDRATAATLEFVARRLAAEPVALVLAARTTGASPCCPRSRTSSLAGLRSTDAAVLLRGGR